MRDSNNSYRLFDIITEPEAEAEAEVTDITRNSAGRMSVQYKLEFIIYDELYH